MNPSAPVPLFRQAWFWVLLSLLSVGCAAFAYRLFPRILPVVSLDIRMDRVHAIQAARDLATAQKWGPSDTIRDVASFGSDPAQAFIELEGGGQAAFASLIQDDLYSPYAWRVRLFKEAETNQTIVRFKPGGEPFDFEETLRQQTPGAALPAEGARAIAENSARAAPWRIALERFKPIETSQVKRPGGRIDHTFVYERPDRQLGEGRLRLRLVVSGDRLTTLKHFVKVPEAFTRRYEEMRSANNGIAMGGGAALVLLYILGGCLGGLMFLLRQRAVLWRQPLAAAAVVAGLQVASGLNAWPLAWLHYDTALSASGFITERLVALVAGNLMLGFVFFLSFLAAEGLSRRAFPHHPELWRIWSREAAPSFAVLGRTLAGYLLAGVMLLYVVVFYYFAIGKLGWWSPSEALVDPDSLSHYWPWLTPLATAAQAGCWEETLFRAVPLAGAALLGSRFGGRKWWIAATFLLQAIVFGAGHANYPGQPAYSRLVELILPSFLFGALYLRFGLVPSIVLHFTYDVVLMSLPLFASSAGGIWIDRTAVVLLSLLPLWIVLGRRWIAGRWSELPAALLNGAWQPPALPPGADANVTATPFIATAIVSDRLVKGVLGAGLAGLVAWIVSTQLPELGPQLTIGRTEAIQRAKAELARRNVRLPESWHADARVEPRPVAAERFAWQTAGEDGYRALLGTYVPNVLWAVRFVSFAGDVAERAEEWRVYMNGAGAVDGVSQLLPEARAGASPSKEEARQLAWTAIRDKWNLDPDRLVEVSATLAKRPHRLDWTFVFRDPAVKSLGAGQARLEVALVGAVVKWAYRFVFVPEEWERAERALQSNIQIGSMVKGIATAALFVAGAGAALVASSRKKLPRRLAPNFFGFMFAGLLVYALIRWPATRASFSSAQPLQLQVTMILVRNLLGWLFFAGATALVAALAARWLRPSPVDERRASLLGVGAGLALVGGFALATRLQAGIGPSWPSWEAAETYLPWCAPAIGSIAPFLFRTTTLLFIFAALDRATRGWQRQRAGAAVLAFAACVLFQLPGVGLSVAGWLGCGVAFAAVRWAVCFFVLRHDLTLFPLTMGVAAAVIAVEGALPRAYPGALPAAGLAALTFLALGWWGTRTLRRIARAHAAETSPAP